jgi:hypothetical protein
MKPIPRRRAISTRIPIPRRTYKAVNTLSQASVTTRLGSAMLEVVRVATAK